LDSWDGIDKMNKEFNNLNIDKMLTEEVNEELRRLGFDPDEIRKKIDDLVKVCSQVRSSLNRLEENCDLALNRLANNINLDAGNDGNNDGNRLKETGPDAGKFISGDGNAGSDDGKNINL